jgi:hypothetical protein
MSNMLKILQSLDNIEKKKLNESAIAECGMSEMEPSMSSPAKMPMTINISGDPSDIATMLKTLNGIEKGADLLSPVSSAFQDDPDIPGRDDVEGDDDLNAGFLGGLGGAIAGGAVGGPAGAIGGGIAGSAAQNAVNNKVAAIGKESAAQPDYDASTEPDERYADQDQMSDISGGINGKKKMYKPAAKGDNPIAVEIKARLAAALAEYQAPNHEISDTARRATKIAQMIKKKINSGDQMDDRDYNQMAELGTVLSRLGTSFGPKTMKDVLNHMIEYTEDRNQEGNKYPEFNVDRFKELIAMAKSSTGESYQRESDDDSQGKADAIRSRRNIEIKAQKERHGINRKPGESLAAFINRAHKLKKKKKESAVSEISSDLAKRYTKNAKMDRDFNDDDIKRQAKSGQSTQDMQRRNSKRTKGINQAKKRMD